MISFPNSKINLGLHIISKRPDGYHNLETIFYPIAFKEALEINTSSTGFEFTQFGIRFENEDNNLCIQAYRLLKADFPQLPDISIHLLKCIPVGAGLGGGSADAAFTLLMLNEKYELHLSREALLVYAVKLGSDCPFFIINSPCHATSRGELLEKIDVDLSGYTLVLINPGIVLSTAKAFSMITPSTPSAGLKKIISLPVTEWKHTLINDFEQPVFNLYPGIREIKDNLYAAGAVYAAMSGSGSTVFGLFEKGADLKALTATKIVYL